MDLQAAVVMDEAHLPEPIHEVAHPRTRRADHRGQRILADLRDDALRSRLLAEVRKQQEKPGQALLAGVEELVHQVLFDPNVARQQIRGEELRELRLSMEQADHGGPAHADDAGRLNRAGGGHAERLARQAALAKEALSLQDADDGFLPSRGDDRELDLAALYVEHGV